MLSNKLKTPFEAENQLVHKTFAELRAFVAGQDGLRQPQTRRVVLKSILCNWVIKFINENHDDGIALLKCLSVARQMIKDISKDSDSIKQIFKKNSNDHFNQDGTNNSLDTLVNMTEWRELDVNFPIELNSRIAKVKTLDGKLKVLKRRLVANDLSERIVNLYNAIAPTQDLTLQEAKEDITPNRSASPVVPQTPVTKKLTSFQSTDEFKKLYGHFVDKKFKKTSQSISKKDVFEFLIGRWVCNFIMSQQYPQDRASIEIMLRVAFEAAEGISNEHYRKDMLSELNENSIRPNNKPVGTPKTGKNAYLGDIHTLMQGFDALLTKKYNDRIVKSESIIDTNKGSTELSKLISSLASKLILLPESESKKPCLIANENAKPVAASHSASSPAPLSPQGVSPPKLTEQFNKLDAHLLKMSVQFNQSEPTTQFDLLNYLTAYWVMNLIKNSDQQNQTNILKILKIAYQTIQEISQHQSRTQILARLNAISEDEKNISGGCQNRIIDLGEMDVLITHFPKLLTRKLETAPNLELTETLNPMPEMGGVNSRNGDELKALIAQLYTAVKTMEFKQEGPIQTPTLADVNVHVVSAEPETPKLKMPPPPPARKEQARTAPPLPAFSKDPGRVPREVNAHRLQPELPQGVAANESKTPAVPAQNPIAASPFILLPPPSTEGPKRRPPPPPAPKDPTGAPSKKPN